MLYGMTTTEKCGTTTTEKCGTTDCNNAARWFSIPEGNWLGNNAIRRCAKCCDRLADTDWLPANYMATRWSCTPEDDV